MIGKPAETTFAAATILHPPFLWFLDEHLTSLREAQANYPRAVPIRLFLSGLTDEHDRDATLKIIEGYRGELDIELLTESTRLACSAARNRVNLGVGTRWTAFFDVDVTLAPQYFDVLAEAIETVEVNAPKVRALAGALGCRDATPIGNYEYLMDLYAYYAKIQNPRIDVQHVDLRDLGSTRGAIPSSLDDVAYERVIYLQGCNHVLHREIFDKLGGHDVRFSGSDDRHMAGKVISSGPAEVEALGARAVREAAFIAQVSKGEVGEREVDELADQVLSFAEVKALATGDPRIMEKAGVDGEVARLTRLEHAYIDDQRRLQRTVELSQHTAEIAIAHADRLDRVLRRVTDTSGDNVTMTIDGRRHTRRIEAGEHLIDLVAREMVEDGTGDPIEVGHLAGLDVHARATLFIDHEIDVTVPEADVELRFYRNQWPNVDPLSFVQRLERGIREIPATITKCRDQAESALAEAAEPSPASANPGNTPPISPSSAPANTTSTKSSRSATRMSTSHRSTHIPSTAARRTRQQPFDPVANGRCRHAQ